MEINKILIIIRRSNGDVFLSTSLIKPLKKAYPNATIDILVNSNTISVAKTLPYINKIYIFNCTWKNKGLFTYIRNEIKLIKNIYKKYDLAINLTASDHSVLYTVLAAKKTISAIDIENKKSWWKKLLLTNYYQISQNKHMIYSITMPLDFLNIKEKKIFYNPQIKFTNEEIKNKFFLKDKYIVFHPSAQFWFRSYPIELTNKFLQLFKNLNMQIVLTGGKDYINQKISQKIIKVPYIKNLIGQTTIEELYSIINFSEVYIGMDTLATHIAASLNKKIIAIYGPNSVVQWGPFNPEIQYSPNIDTPPITRYGNFTIIQANMNCVPCNKNGCNGHGKSECLYNIPPETIFNEVKKWLNK